MECNRDEALRAKTIAEDRIGKKDFPGAKKFALKAKTLYPELDGITQILTTVDVYISAENKISGETDWYGVLSVSPSADDETLRKQYRKLALMLHPDKNKSIGADGAFKLISEAWSLLSDKSKRLAYNQRTQNNVAKPKPKPPVTTPTPNKRSDTFWTICLRCKMHYEYLKMYLNHTLLCPNCHEAFMATETAPNRLLLLLSSNFVFLILLFKYPSHPAEVCCDSLYALFTLSCAC
ncbi:Dnaj homolog subfamily b member 14 [Phtheirospermum japonicum]|uniref:Dnaj homolog subfamily b member 14 n=1 Tax=Phtheirospermum japonicum TaxID=374723 RepID=A0A830DP99_9LAMI|nr:Dnaj homolog subfamily b member 14 [Phtheirospermum japonicum]